MTLREASERIATAFEAGVAPWSRSSRLGFACRLPVNAATGKRFRGINAWLLELAAIDRNDPSRFWASPGQWDRLGGIVRGVGTPVIGDGDARQNGGEGLLYSVEQVEVRPGAQAAALERFRVAPPKSPDHALAQQLLDATGARIVADERYYCVLCCDPTQDYIAIKPLDPLSGDPDFWWSVLFHELTHWVAEGFQRVRCRGEYNHCELIAEIGATLLTDRRGIPMRGEILADCDLVRDWVAQLRANIGYLTLASAVAEVAVGYVRNHGRPGPRA